MSDTQFNISDPIQYLAIQLHSALQLYLEGHGGGYIGSITSIHFPPRARFNKAMVAIRDFIARNRWEGYFSTTWESQSMEGALGQLFDGFGKLVERSDRLKQKYISLDKLDNISTDKIHGQGADKAVLGGIIEFLLQHSEFYKIVVLDGSIGSGDYKPGWSDVDIFLALDSKVLHSQSRLKQARKFAQKLQQKAYHYCILQLHGIFYSSEYNFRYHLDTLFPLACLFNGMSHSADHQLVLHQPVDDQSASYYFFNHIYQSSRQLLSRISHLDDFQKVLLMHRVYAFPFAFLATRGIYQYKRDAFQTLCEVYADVFNGVAQFYRSLNEFYHSWHVDKLRTINWRRHLNFLFDLRFLNRALLPLEREIVQNINQFYQFFLRKENINRFEEYLEISWQVLAVNK